MKQICMQLDVRLTLDQQSIWKWNWITFCWSWFWIQLLLGAKSLDIGFTDRMHCNKVNGAYDFFSFKTFINFP